MSLRLLNVPSDRVLIKVNEKVTGMGVKLRDERSREWKMKRVITYKGDAVLVAESREDIHRIIYEILRWVLSIKSED